MSEFADKIVIVTGSSSGIGAAIAVEFAKQDAKVVVTGRSEEGIQKTVNEIKSLGKEEPLQIIGDIALESVQKKLVEDTITKYGRLDILVNNAGVISPFDQVDNERLLEGFDQVHAINVRAPLNLIHLSVPHIEKTKGNIINISSVASTIPVSIEKLY